MSIPDTDTIDELLADCERRGWSCGVRRAHARGAAPLSRPTRIYEASVVDRGGEAVVVCSIHPRLALHAAMAAMLRRHTTTPPDDQGSHG